MTTTIIKKLDPRTKLVLTFFYAAWVVGAGGYGWLVSAFTLLAAFIGFTGRFKEYVRWLRLVLPMSIFFGAVIWWTANLSEAGFAALKLLTLTSVFFAFFTTTLPEDLANALVKAGLPYPVAFVLSTSLQFVPVMSRKVKNIMDAQRARGIPLEPGWAALRHYPAFLSPVLIQAFQLAEALAEAMESRGFGLTGRTFLKEFRMTPGDWMAMSAGLALLLVLFFFM
jgi:energy-coupling factor transport system permease protein